MRAGPKPQPTAVTLPPLRAKAPARRVLEFFETYLRHTAGAKAGQPLRLAPWQRDEIIRPLFGTLRPDGLRQYRTAFVSMPRRGGKSTLAAGIGLWLLVADDEPGAYVVSAAANREQARVVFDQAARMVEASPALSALVQVYRSELVIPSTGSRYKVLSRDSKVQHGMDLSGVVIDELHAHRDADLYRVLTSSTGSRRQPLTFVITTASSDVHSIAAEVYAYSEKVRTGVITDPTWFSVVYSAPADADPWSEATWRACNPALRSGFRSLDELRTAALQAREVPAREASFRTLYLNQWFTAVEARWLSLAAWDACQTPPDPHTAGLQAVLTHSDGGGRYLGIPPKRAFLGLDLASTRDLTALAIVYPGDDGTVALRVECWVPEDTIPERERTDRVPYQTWVDQGWLRATPGNTCDYAFIEQRIYALMAELDVQAIAADPWNGKDLITRLQANGVPIFPVQQTMGNLSAAAKALETLILSGRLRHDGNPVVRWAVSNCVADVDANGNVRPSKKRSREKIDPLSATVTALSQWLIAPGSPYDTRDPVLVAL
jgi:phage terminase large subunit-like protein